MKKFILALAVLAMTASFTVEAKGRKDCSKAQDCAKTECPKQARTCVFEDLNLTDAQKEQFKVLKQKRMEARKKNKQMKATKVSRELRKEEFLAEVKTILTPEQYVKFLENSFTNDNDNLRMKKHGRHGHKGPRGHQNNSGEAQSGK